MTRDSAFIIDVWACIKPYVQAKDRQDVADRLVAIFDEYGFTDGFEDEHFERILAASIKERFGFEDEEENEYDD